MSSYLGPCGRKSLIKILWVNYQHKHRSPLVGRAGLVRGTAWFQPHHVLDAKVGLCRPRWSRRALRFPLNKVPLAQNLSLNVRPQGKGKGAKRWCPLGSTDSTWKVRAQPWAVNVAGWEGKVPCGGCALWPVCGAERAALCLCGSHRDRGAPWLFPYSLTFPSAVWELGRCTLQLRSPCGELVLTLVSWVTSGRLLLHLIFSAVRWG